jgi:anti-sigma factor RsiW
MSADRPCDMTLLVQADFDGELDPAQAVRLTEHREGCRSCQATWETLARARRAVREGATCHRAPTALRAAIEARLSATADGAPPTPRRRSLLPWWREATSFGLGAAVAAALLLLTVLPDRQDSIVAALVDDHVRSLQPGHLTDVGSSDRHTVKPWFDGRLDFAPPVKDLAPQGFPLIGGRLDYLGGRAVAALVYENGRHPINLFVWPAGDAAGGMPPGGARHGYNFVHWEADGMSLWAVSDLESDGLRDFVRQWQAAR